MERGASRRRFAGTLAGTLSWTFFDQNAVASDPNACGPTALGMVLIHLGRLEPTLESMRALDREVRAWGGFTAPDDLIEGARAYGLEAHRRNHMVAAELEALVAEGRPVIAMVDGGSTPHWVVVRSIERGRVHLADPGVASGSIKPIAAFESEWADPLRSRGRLLSALADYSAFVVVLGRGSSRSCFANAYADAAADAITRVANAVVRARAPLPMIALSIDAPIALLLAASSLPGALGRSIELVGRALERVGPLRLLGVLVRGAGWTLKSAGNVLAAAATAAAAALAPSRALRRRKRARAGEP
jgi:hypothetical protein